MSADGEWRDSDREGVQRAPDLVGGDLMSISVRMAAVAIALALVAAARSDDDAETAGESSPPVEEPQEGEPASVDADLTPPDGDTDKPPRVRTRLGPRRFAHRARVYRADVLRDDRAGHV